jgi:hypothetical protein
MPLRYDIPIASDLVFVSGYGLLTAREAAKLSEHVLADTRLAKTFRMLVRIGEVEVGHSATQEIEAATMAASHLVERGLQRTAVVAADDFGYGLGCTFATRALENGLTVEVFRDDIEAVTWLFDADSG